MTFVFLVLFIGSLLGALGLGAMSAHSDFKGLTIPNSYSLIVFVCALVNLFSLFFLLESHGLNLLISHFLGALIVFVLTFAMFGMKVMGAGDSKMASAFALFYGLKTVVIFLFFVTAIGGVLGLFALIVQKLKPFKTPPEGSWLEKLQAGENKVPYGIAIFLGAVVAFIYKGYFGIEFYANF